MDIPGYFRTIWFVYRYIVWVSYVAAKIYAEKKLMAVDRSISKADQLRPQHPWITTCWKLGVGKYTLGASQNYKSSSQNLLESLDFLWVFLAGPESREQRDGSNWLETRHQQTVNSEILVRSPTSKKMRFWRRLSWKSLSFCSSFIWYCPSLHVKPEWNAWGSSQNMVASDPKEAWTKRRSESQSDQEKTWVLWGIQWIGSCFFQWLGYRLSKRPWAVSTIKGWYFVAPFSLMNSWGFSDFIEYQHGYLKKTSPHIHYFLEFPMGFYSFPYVLAGRDQDRWQGSWVATCRKGPWEGPLMTSWHPGSSHMILPSLKLT